MEVKNSRRIIALNVKAVFYEILRKYSVRGQNVGYIHMRLGQRFRFPCVDNGGFVFPDIIREGGILQCFVIVGEDIRRILKNRVKLLGCDLMLGCAVALVHGNGIISKIRVYSVSIK